NDLDLSSLVDIGKVRARFGEARQTDGKYDAAKVQELAKGETVHVAGRIVAERTFGKAAFLRVRDRTGEIQLFCRADKLGEHYARLGDFDVGDIIEAYGVPMVTKTGELSIETTS